MSYGTNLSTCLKKLKLTNKEAAEKIGISCNTLSNILNEKFSPSDESQSKISAFLIANGFSEKDLTKEKMIFKNFRIFSTKELSGIEKSQFRDEFYSFVEMLKKSDSNENKQIWADYFDYCDRPTEFFKQESFLERRESLSKKLNENSNADSFSIVYDYFKDISNGEIFIDIKSPVDIIFLLDSLGIRRFFTSFATEKISSFSTSFVFKEAEKSNFDFEQDPVVVINTRVCNTTEKCLFEMAKQFYYMIFLSKKFNLKSINEIQIENAIEKKKAEKFAEDIMIGTDVLKLYLEENKRWLPQISPIGKIDKDFFLENYDFSYVVNEIKRVFRVGYKLAIKKLFEIKFEYCAFFSNVEEAENFYFACLKKYDERYKNKAINGEPEPLPTSFRGRNFEIIQSLDSKECVKS